MKNTVFTGSGVAIVTPMNEDMTINYEPLKPFHTELCVEAGCDEAGRGCLAGPVFAAAVILPPDFHNKSLTDSKQLTEKQRYGPFVKSLKRSPSHGLWLRSTPEKLTESIY